MLFLPAHPLVKISCQYHSCLLRYKSSYQTKYEPKDTLLKKWRLNTMDASFEALKRYFMQAFHALSDKFPGT